MKARHLRRVGSAGLAALIGVTMLGCDKMVRVIDAQGIPIAGATVRAMYQSDFNGSFIGPSSMTDLDGRAKVETRWSEKEIGLSVYAQGHPPWISWPFPSRWPQTIQLKIEKSSPFNPGLPPSLQQEPGVRPPYK